MLRWVRIETTFSQERLVYLLRDKYEEGQHFHDAVMQQCIRTQESKHLVSTLVTHYLQYVEL